MVGKYTDYGVGRTWLNPGSATCHLGGLEQTVSPLWAWVFPSVKEKHTAWLTGAAQCSAGRAGAESSAARRTGLDGAGRGRVVPEEPGVPASSRRVPWSRGPGGGRWLSPTWCRGAGLRPPPRSSAAAAARAIINSLGGAGGQELCAYSYLVTRRLRGGLGPPAPTQEAGAGDENPRRPAVTPGAPSYPGIQEAPKEMGGGGGGRSPMDNFRVPWEALRLGFPDFKDTSEMALFLKSHYCQRGLCPLFAFFFF